VLGAAGSRPGVATDRHQSAVFNGPVGQTQDLTIFNVTPEAVVARQVRAVAQAVAVPGKSKLDLTYYRRPERPAWWAEAIIPDEEPPPSMHHL